MEVMRIPAERIAVLLGKNGATKRLIERRSRTRITVSDDGEIQVSGEPYDEWKVRDVITAVGRGFNPQKALKLLGEDCYLKVVDLREIFRSEKHVARHKGRIIGSEGKTRRLIEEIAEVDLSIYGHTVALIGGLEELSLAEKAIDKLLRGTPHSGVYRTLERGRKKIVEKRLKLWKGE